MARATANEPAVTTRTSETVPAAVPVMRAALVVPPSDAIARAVPTHGESHAIADRAAELFAVFTARLCALGVTATELPASDAPFGSACGDLAAAFPDGAFLMRPSDLSRRPELAAVEAALGRANEPIVGRIAAPGLLDGGDVLRVGGTYYVGVPRVRRSELGIPAVAHGNALGRTSFAAAARERGFAVVEVPYNANVLRLRSVAAAIDDKTVLVASGVLDAAAFSGCRLLEAPRGEDLGAGVLSVGPRRVLANLRFRKTLPLLRKAKVAVEVIDLWEFGKLGITPSLLALPIRTP